MIKFNGPYYNLGVIFKEKMEFEKAIFFFSQSIDLNPYDEKSYLNRGVARAQAPSKDYLGSVLDFSRAIELNPDNALHHNNRGFTRMNLGDFEMALEDFNKAILLDKNYGMANKNRARSKVKLNRISEACKDYQIAMNLGETISEKELSVCN
jgi:tetratricopeptide (TPR) repeat protein